MSCDCERQQIFKRNKSKEWLDNMCSLCHLMERESQNRVLITTISTITTITTHGFSAQEYADYIHSTAWRNRAKEAIRLHPYCALCHKTSHFHVHHNTYVHFKNEKPEDITVLCDACHMKWHGRNNSHTEV